MKNITKENDKRRHPRFPVGLTMDIFARGASVGKCRGAIADLSVGGMTLRSNAELETGMCLCLKLNPSFEIRGEVRHAKGSTVGGMRRYGVRFHKIGYVSARKPADFINAKFQSQAN